MHQGEIRHGYGHDPRSRQDRPVEDALAYHVRRYRHLYGHNGISQRALAMIAHVGRVRVEELETASSLQGRAETLIRVAIALRRPVEDLVSPARLRALRDDVEGRRSALGGAATLGAEAPAEKEVRISLAIAYRSPYLITAVSDGKTVLELRQRRVSSRTSTAHLRGLIAREARSYGVREVIVEADTAISRYLYAQGVPHRTLTFRAAKQYVARSEDKTPPPNKAFFQALVGRHPELSRYVKILPATGRVAMSERWRTARLIVATLALAAAVAKAPVPPSTDGHHAGRSAPRLRP